jgi:hypothetical protein
MKAQASNILPLNEIIPLAQSLARKEAHRPDDVDDLVQIGLFAYHKAELRHRKLRLPVDKPMSLARTTLQRAIRGYYWQLREWQTRGEPNKDIGLEQVGLAHDIEFMVARQPMLAVDINGGDYNGGQAELLEFDDYFNALEKKCGRVAREVVENLLMPSGECAGKILLEVWTKQAGQKEFSGKSRRARRSQPRGVKKEIRISHRLVRDAMQIPPTEWVRTMERIREFTRNWIGR